MEKLLFLKYSLFFAGSSAEMKTVIIAKHKKKTIFFIGQPFCNDRFVLASVFGLTKDKKVKRRGRDSFGYRFISLSKSIYFEFKLPLLSELQIPAFCILFVALSTVLIADGHLLGTTFISLFYSTFKFIIGFIPISVNEIIDINH